MACCRKCPENASTPRWRTNYRKRETSISQANRTIIHKFLTRRDHISNRKVDVAKHSADFCEAKFGPLTPGTWEQFRAGTSLPAGWFIAYKNAHPQLTKACGTTNRDSPDHQRILRLYKQAVKLYAVEKQRSALAQHSQEAHRGDGGGRCDVLAAVDNPNAKHTNKTSRSGCKLWKTQLTFKRRTERRRDFGVGRPKSAIVVREALIDWYSVIRHNGFYFALLPLQASELVTHDEFTVEACVFKHDKSSLQLCLAALPPGTEASL